LAIFNAAHQNLGQRHISELKFALVAALFQTDLENVNRTAKGADTNLGSILTPGTGSDRVVILDLLTGDLVPLRALCVEVVYVEAIKVTDDTGLAGRVESGTSELLNLLIFGVVEALEAVAGRLIERDLSATRNFHSKPGFNQVTTGFLTYLKFENRFQMFHPDDL